MIPKSWARAKRQGHNVRPVDRRAMLLGAALAFMLLYLGVTVYNVFSAVPAAFTDGVRLATFIVVGIVILVTELGRGKE